MHSLSVLLLAVETSIRTRTALEISQRHQLLVCEFVRCIYQPWLLFEGGVYFAQSFRLCGYYSKAVSDRRNMAHATWSKRSINHTTRGSPGLAS